MVGSVRCVEETGPTATGSAGRTHPARFGANAHGPSLKFVAARYRDSQSLGGNSAEGRAASLSARSRGRRLRIGPAIGTGRPFLSRGFGARLLSRCLPGFGAIGRGRKQSGGGAPAHAGRPESPTDARPFRHAAVGTAASDSPPTSRPGTAHALLPGVDCHAGRCGRAGRTDGKIVHGLCGQPARGGAVFAHGYGSDGATRPAIGSCTPWLASGSARTSTQRPRAARSATARRRRQFFTLPRIPTPRIVAAAFHPRRGAGGRHPAATKVRLILAAISSLKPFDVA